MYARVCSMQQSISHLEVLATGSRRPVCACCRACWCNVVCKGLEPLLRARRTQQYCAYLVRPSKDRSGDHRSGSGCTVFKPCDSQACGENFIQVLGVCHEACMVGGWVMHLPKTKNACNYLTAGLGLLTKMSMRLVK